MTQREAAEKMGVTARWVLKLVERCRAASSEIETGSHRRCGR